MMRVCPGECEIGRRELYAYSLLSFRIAALSGINAASMARTIQELIHDNDAGITLA